MTLDSHPASFDFLNQGPVEGSSLEPPAVWHFEGVDYDLAATASGWDVLRDGVLLGCLEYEKPFEMGDPGRWRIGDPRHPDLGAGASWGDWTDAVATLIDYRRTRDVS